LIYMEHRDDLNATTMSEIIRPTLLLDKGKCLVNIRMMAEKAARHNLIFRPHFKTHQSAVIGEWFRKEGVNAITVSSLKMAEYFTKHGWNDITLAFPFNILETENLNRIPLQVKMNLTLLDTGTVNYLNQHLTRPAGVFIKIDAGCHRTGIESDDLSSIKKILDAIGTEGPLQFSGFLVHSGHTYQAKLKAAIESIHQSTLEKLDRLRHAFSSIKQDLVISIGDTPSCSIMDDFKGVDEIRPGNFVFYDSMQWHLGSCEFSQIAVAVACPVVAVHAGRNEIIIHGGAVHFSKDHLLSDDGTVFYGEVVTFNGSGWSNPVPDTFLRSLSQEHGIVRAGHKFISEVKPGMIIGIIPVHSCLTAHAMKEYMATDGEIIEHLEKSQGLFLS
jgi:D-serine deaminase-like pyridoxal phosphate-dependent protein